jgi:hypothetical protein
MGKPVMSKHPQFGPTSSSSSFVNGSLDFWVEPFQILSSNLVTGLVLCCVHNHDLSASENSLEKGLPW